MRTEKETIIDRLLLLYSVKKANEYGCMDGAFKLQKIPFASELEMNNDGVKGFNYPFFRYRYGPLSKEIYADGGILHAAGIISTLKTQPIKLTDKGKEILASVSPLMEQNAEITNYIDAAAKMYAPLSFGALKNKIYALSIKWGGDTWEVGEMLPYMDMLDKLEDKEARISFQIDDDWIDSLWGTLTYNEEQSRKLNIIHEVA